MLTSARLNSALLDRVIYQRVDSLQINPKNPRTHSARLGAELISLEREQGI